MPPTSQPISAATFTAATFTLSDAGRIASFDAAAERLFHCRAGDVVGELVTFLLPSLPLGLLKSDAGQALRLQACPPDGSSVEVELILAPVHSGAQKLWSGVLLDLGRHRPDEDRLQRSEEAYRRLFDDALVGIFQTSPDGHYLRANAALAHLCGYDSPDALMARQLNAGRDLYVDPRRRAEFQRLLEENETVTDFESEIRRRDGSRLWISENARAVRAPGGLLLRYEGTVQEISARRRAEEARRESAAQLQAVFDAAAVGLACVDRAGRVSRANPALYAMLGCPPETLHGTVLTRLTHPDDAHANLELQWDLQEGRRDGYQTEKRCCRADGSLLWANLTMSLVRDGAGRPQFAVAIVEDITVRRDAQQKMLALNRHREQQAQHAAARHEIDRAILSRPDLDVIFSLVLEQVQAQLGADAAAVLTCGPDEDLRYAAGMGLGQDVSALLAQAVGVGPAGRAARQRCVVELSGFAAAPEVRAGHPLLESEPFAAYWAVPLIIKGTLKGILEVFHRAALLPDAGWRERLDVLAGQAAFAIDSAAVFGADQRSNQELAEAYEATLESWGRALDLRDQEAEGHCRRVTNLAERLALALGLSEAEQVQVRRGALLHDIGKMSIPDRILLKTDQLTPTEWRIMRRHPQDAYDMLSPIAFLRPALAIPLCHHEKWDGSGYPQGLRGDEIPLAARLFAIVDVWDALTSDRPYRPAWPAARALDHIRFLSGTHFDPHFVPVFMGLMTAFVAPAPLSEPADTDLLPLRRAA